MKVLLIPVANSKEKVHALTKLAAKHLYEKDPLLIICPDENALKFADRLLWTEPAESFLPHMASHIPCSALITLTTVKENLNNAGHALNLAQEPLFCPDLATLYEFDEQTSGPRREALEARYHAYREKGYSLINFRLPL